MAFQNIPDFGVITPESIPLNYGLSDLNQINQMQISAPNVGGTGTGWFGNATNWMNNNGQTINTLLSGIGALSSGYNSFRNYGLAKDNFALQKRAFETNLRNSEKTYNNALEDRIRGRSSEMSESDIQAAIARQRLGG